MKSNIAAHNKNGHDTWKKVVSSNDPKHLWERIDWGGKLKCGGIKADASCNEFVAFVEERCSLPKEHSNYDDIHSDIYNPLLESKITEQEIIDTAKSMGSSSKARCGIPVPLFMLVISSIVTMLAWLLNKVFLATYPTCWSAIIKCLPKKGKLDVPNLRGIGLKDLLAKLYDAILKRRLDRWLQVPDQQTAYQKGKGCYVHVLLSSMSNIYL